MLIQKATEKNQQLALFYRPLPIFTTHFNTFFFFLTKGSHFILIASDESNHYILNFSSEITNKRVLVNTLVLFCIIIKTI